MQKVASKKIARKITKFWSNLPNNIPPSLLISCSSTSKHLCLINAGLSNGFTKEEIFEIFSGFGDINELIMLGGKSFSIISFNDEQSAIESYKQLNGSFCLKGDTSVPKPLYMSFIECVEDTLSERKEEPVSWPNGLQLENNFVSEEEEKQLLELTQLEKQSSQLKHRTVKHYGFAFQYDSNKVNRNPLANGIPVEMDSLLEKFKEIGLAQPNQLTVNYYVPGQGIPFHIDTHSSFEDGIISLSLGSDTVMEFKHPDGSHVNVTLPRRSCLIMSKESRYIWSHGITPRKYDLVDAPTGGLTIRLRQNRTSLTFRKIRLSDCDCVFTMFCDSRQSINHIAEGFSEETADNIEKNHVFHVYDEIADHFSDTRHTAWPNVLAFIQSLPAGSLLIDVGCGNGKYLNSSQFLYSIGCDRSNRLLEVCRNNNHQVVNADCRHSPIRDGIADAVICIAVIHHLATEERRLQTVKDISRMLSKGGKALIYVWAKEQQIGAKKSTYLLQKKNETSQAEIFPTTILPVHENRTNFKHADVLVPWKKNSKKTSCQNLEKNDGSDTFLRFYHVFRKGELDYLCSQVSNIIVRRSFYDQGNWCVELEKN